MKRYLLVYWVLSGWWLGCGETDENLNRAKALHQSSFVFDAHCDSVLALVKHGVDLGKKQPDGHLDLPRLREGGVNAQLFALWVAEGYWPDAAYQRANQQLDSLERFFENYTDEIALARTADDINDLYKNGKIAGLIGIEGGHAIEDSLENLREFYERGVRLMTLTWMYNTNWADGSGDEPAHGGLTDLGVEIVQEMNRLGMVVDLSHVSDETFFDALAVVNQPVVVSHSCIRALCDHHRNVTDEMLLALADNGGVIGINFYPEYLASGGNATIKTLVNHIDYAVEIAGIDHVGLGSDFDGVPRLPSGLDDVSDLPKISAELLDRGYREREIKKILGENLLRVFKKVLKNSDGAVLD